jgi:hypothetical protein
MLHNQIRAACPCSYCMSMSMLHVDVNASCQCQCPECRTVWHPVSLVPDWKKLTMPKPVRYRTKLTQSGIFLVQYWTKIWDAGMPMPALVSSMPMPSYVFFYVNANLRPDLMPPPLWALLVWSLPCCCPAAQEIRQNKIRCTVVRRDEKQWWAVTLQK